MFVIYIIYVLTPLLNKNILMALIWLSQFNLFLFHFQLAGVASGATRAALTQHFALQNNAADISAKVPMQPFSCLNENHQFMYHSPFTCS